VSGDFGQVRVRAQDVHNTNHQSPITNQPTGTALKMSITPITNPITNHQHPAATQSPMKKEGRIRMLA
jgi:hypothetical protein